MVFTTKLEHKLISQGNIRRDKFWGIHFNWVYDEFNREKFMTEGFKNIVLNFFLRPINYSRRIP